MIVGLETPTSGRVLLDGEVRRPSSKRRDRAARARQVQMVFQDPYSSLDPRQTVFKCLDEVDPAALFARSGGPHRTDPHAPRPGRS